ncbi:MAG TPA: hypothetical protein VES67_04180 [Vicinamibacterales bacterium]|nr:hypothetical protein [Vicinamibacterales bacterium]
MSARKPRLVRSNPQRPEADVREPGDFSDPESQRVLDAMAVAVARELGRQAARDWWQGENRR